MPRAGSGQPNTRTARFAFAWALLSLLAFLSPAGAPAARGDGPATGGTQPATTPAQSSHDHGASKEQREGPSSDSFIWPVPRGPIFGPFGENRGDHFHSGLDIAKPMGTAIRAAAAGRVLFAGPSGAYGLYTCIAHRSLTSCYAHQSAIRIQVGASVAQGQVIGSVGSTGNSSGSHLHFEVRQGTVASGTPLNPAAYLPGGLTLSHAAGYRGPLDDD